MFHNLMKCHNLMTNPIWVPAGGIFSYQDPTGQAQSRLCLPPLVLPLCSCDLSALPPSVSLAISWLGGFPALQNQPALLHGEAWEGSCFGRRLLGLSSSNNMSGWRFTPLEHLKIGFIYLFIFGCSESSWLCGLSLLVVSRGCSRCGPQAVERVSFSSCSSRAWCSGPVGIFLDQGSKPCPLHWQVGSYLLDHQGSGLWNIFLEHLWLSLLCSSVWSNLWVTSLLDLLSQNPYF